MERYYSEICLDGLHKTTESLRLSDVMADIQMC
jgi:hypothetical protein